MNSHRGFWEGIPFAYSFYGMSYSFPKFSPDGRYLAYTASQEKGTHLYLRDLETGLDQQLTAEYPLSTGTAYGGGTFCWSSDSKKLYFTSKGTLYEVPVEGGVPRRLSAPQKSFAPFESAGVLLFSTEHDDHMSIGRLELEGNNWPERLELDDSFLYDAVLNPVSGDIAVHAWSFPNMSWNSSRILIYRADGTQKNVAAGVDEATCQPRFSPDGKLLAYISDKSGWWNLWIAQADGEGARQLVERNEEHCYATWVTGECNFVWTADSRKIVYTVNRAGKFTLDIVDVESGEVKNLELEPGYYEKLSYNSRTNEVAYVFSNYRTPTQIRVTPIERPHETRVILQSGLKTPSDMRDKMAEPREITYPLSDGGEGHGLLYVLPDPEGRSTSCPTIVMVHGGPTGMSRDNYAVEKQYWVSRGWAVFAVNHRGSIGYGRRYREALNGKWGVYDVKDTVDAVNHLVKEGITDPSKMVIMGGSAGGYTTLMCLAKYPGTFTAGVNLYGVSDLFGLSEETHYLESQYDTTLVGPLPESSKAFFERSPIYIADRITDPLLILQGEEDPVVPKVQSDLIAERAKGHVEYKLYPGEGHGFRLFESLRDMYKRVDSFLRKFVLYTRPRDM